MDHLCDFLRVLSHLLISHLLLIHLLLVVSAQDCERGRPRDHFSLFHFVFAFVLKYVLIVAVLEHLTPLEAQPALLFIILVHHAHLLLLHPYGLLIVKHSHSAI